MSQRQILYYSVIEGSVMINVKYKLILMA